MGNVTPIDEEYMIEGDGALVYQIDTEGTITYANKKFREVSWYAYDELVGQNETVLRHPDMPNAVFKKMWDTIKNAQVFNGTIKFLRKDGLYFWVDLEVLPIKDDNAEITTYMAVARPVSRKDIEENEDIYRRMLEAQNRGESEI